MLVVLFVGAAGCLFRLLLEPSYKGRPFGYWFDRLPLTLVMDNGVLLRLNQPWTEAEANNDYMAEGHDPETREMVERGRKSLEAVRAIGADCVPFLLAELQRPDRDFHNQLLSWGHDARLISARQVTPRIMRREKALSALIELAGGSRHIATLVAKARSNDPLARECALRAIRAVTEQNPKLTRSIRALEKSQYAAQEE